MADFETVHQGHHFCKARHHFCLSCYGLGGVMIIESFTCAAKARCHTGPCPPCAETSLESCFCGKNQAGTRPFLWLVLVFLFFFFGISPFRSTGCVAMSTSLATSPAAAGWSARRCQIGELMTSHKMKCVLGLRNEDMNCFRSHGRKQACRRPEPCSMHVCRSSHSFLLVPRQTALFVLPCCHVS